MNMTRNPIEQRKRSTCEGGRSLHGCYPVSRHGFWKKMKHWLPVKEYEKEYRNPLDEEVEDEYI